MNKLMKTYSRYFKINIMERNNYQMVRCENFVNIISSILNDSINAYSIYIYTRFYPKVLEIYLLKIIHLH